MEKEKRGRLEKERRSLVAVVWVRRGQGLLRWGETHGGDWEIAAQGAACRLQKNPIARVSKILEISMDPIPQISILKESKT